MPTKISTYLLPGAISKQLHTVKRLSAGDLFSLAATAVLLIPFIAFIYGINKIICSRVTKVNPEINIKIDTDVPFQTVSRETSV
jgi:hypothetical protein